MKKGFFGIGIYNPQHDCNIGGLFRSAYAFNVDFVFTIGGRKYKKQAADTCNTINNLPYFYYKDFEDFNNNRPVGARLVSIEIGQPNSKDLIKFTHIPQCIYLLGSEASGIPNKILQKSQFCITIPTQICLNVATAGSIVLYDRKAKLGY